MGFGCIFCSHLTKNGLDFKKEREKGVRERESEVGTQQAHLL